MALTKQRQIFSDEYLADLNGTRAYKVAYPAVTKDSTAAAAANRLLKDEQVKAYIDEELERLKSARVADTQEILEHLTAAMRGEIKEEVVVVEGTGEGCSTAKVKEKQISEKDRLKAAELLGKRYSLFTDKVDLAGEMDLKVVVDYGDDEGS